MNEEDNVLDVLTLKRRDSRPTLSMSIEEINKASDQPSDDASWDKYVGEEFKEATRIELHMDYWYDDDDRYIRVVDGREAEWVSQSDTVSITLEREDTQWVGEYRFEWVLVYDEEAVPSEEAQEVNTVPSVGFFTLEVEEPTSRDLASEPAEERSVDTLTLGTLTGVDDGSVALGSDVDAQNTHTVTNLREPQQSGEAARYDELEGKADSDGGGTDTLENYQLISSSEVSSDSVNTEETRTSSADGTDVWRTYVDADGNLVDEYVGE